MVNDDLHHKTGRVVVVGSYNADLTTYVPRLPRPGESVVGDRFVIGAGGKGSNQAIAAARLGAEVAFVGRVGRDSFGATALEWWNREGINTQHIGQDDEHPTGVAPIIVDQSGENMIVVALGANLAVSKSDVDAATETIAAANVLITQLEISHAVAAYALKVAKSHGVTTILNPAPASKLTSEMLMAADYITPNETELEVLSGMEIKDKSVESAARTLLTRPDQTVIVTLGKQGALWVTMESAGQIPAYLVTAVDTTGAGDAFNAGLAAGLAERLNIGDALKMANATAALCVTKSGTAASMPTRSEVEHFLRAQTQ
jgi:ribokinase